MPFASLFSGGREDTESESLIVRGRSASRDYGAEQQDDSQYYLGEPKEALLNTGHQGLTKEEAIKRLER